MKNNRKDSHRNLLETRVEMMKKLFGDGAPTSIIIERLNNLKGIKKYFYTFQFIIENTQEDKDIFASEFETSMSFWINDKVSSKFMEDRATHVLFNQINIKEDNQYVIDFDKPTKED
jgi:hypothetical protein